MSQPPAPQGSQLEITELNNELAFQKVLLSSIDDSVQNCAEARSEVQAEIKAIERRLRDLRRGTTTSASNSGTASASQPRETSSSDPSSATCPSAATAQVNNQSTASLYPNQAKQPGVSLGATSTSSTPNSVDSMRDLTSPSRMNLPTRKRSHSEHLDGGLAPPFEDNKSRRTSPSPLITGPTTPASSSGDDEFEMFDREFFQQQKAEEERIERERHDAELARSIQSNPYSFPSMSLPANPTQSATSAFDRISGVRPPPSSSSATPLYNQPQFGQSSSARKPLQTWNKDSRSFTSFSPSALKSEPRFGVQSDASFHSPSLAFKSSNQHGKQTGTKSDSSSHPMPGSYRDDSPNTTDSELEIIPPTAFHDNGRHSRQPAYAPNASTTDDAAMRRGDGSATHQLRQIALFGHNQVRRWMESPGYGDSLVNSSIPMNIPGSASSNVPVGNRKMGNHKSTQPEQKTYVPGAGNLIYPSASLGNGSSSGMSGFTGGNALNGRQTMHPGYPGGSMHIPGASYVQNNVKGIFKHEGYAFHQPGASQKFPGMPGSVSTPDPLADIIRRANSQSYDHLTGFLLNPYSDQMAGQLDYIMNDPRKTNQEIKELLENIRPDVDLPAEDREGTPDGLKYPLYEHQKIALTWLKAMEEGSNKGGILADDMGLGKTISSLALLLSRPSTDRARKTTLIVGPVALVRQWEREIRTKITVTHKLSTHMVHGQARKLGWDELRTFDIVLTTYGTLGAEFRRMEKYVAKLKADGIRDVDEAPMRKLFPLLGPKSLFYRVILDEAQCIKNKNTIAAKAACQLKSLTRFCLTGTPMMNNVGELYSLIHFLRIKPYNEWNRFQADFGMLTKGDHLKRDVQNTMRKLQAVLKAILLRRTKTSLIDGKPIINLPPKTEEIQHVVFSEDEQLFYNALETKTQLQFNKYLKAGTVGKNYSNILVLLLRLRQCCCHPHLITDFDKAAPAGADIPMDSMIKLAKSLAPDVVGRLLAADGFECPVCYDGVENPSIVIPCGHDTCAECLTKISDQAMQQNVADGNEAGGACRCPTCRGAIEMTKIIDYLTFKKVHMPDLAADNDDTAEVDSDSSDDTRSELEDESDADDNGDLRDFIVPDVYDDKIDEDEVDDVTGGNGDDNAEKNPEKSKSKSKSEWKKASKRRQKDRKGKGRERPSKHLSIAMMKKEASRSAEGRRRYMKYLRKNWQPSAKVTKCVELLEKFHEENQKTIIFSQFVSLLDLLQVPIDQKSWTCERYDGSMSADARNAAIVRFTDKPNCNIMLISLKAGNAGLNLVAASRVIILDPFWNPFIEMQAVDRAYRIGQQRSIEVHRILIKTTVEDRIIELQQRKKKLVDAALDEGASKSLGRLDERQLAFLFGVSDGN